MCTSIRKSFVSESNLREFFSDIPSIPSPCYLYECECTMTTKKHIFKCFVSAFCAGLRRLEQVLERLRAMNKSDTTSVTRSGNRNRSLLIDQSIELALDMRHLSNRSQTHQLLRSADLKLRQRPRSRDLILDLETSDDLQSVLQAVGIGFCVTRIHTFKSIRSIEYTILFNMPCSVIVILIPTIYAVN